MNNEMPPVTVDKIIEKSKQWTLEGDCTLLQWMNQISKDLEERVNKTSSALNDMSTKLDRTSIALSNATNNLAALQYSQFVENRVHDDDETLAKPADVPSEDVTDKKDSTQDIYSFLRKNLEMMNSCHEAYSISYDDSDDDDDEPVTNVVYRSKNPYEARPLPHIYGSNLWKEKWHIGLCDSDNDFSGDENSEQFSESSSTADDSYESTAPTMSEWDSTAWGLNTHQNLERKEIHTPSNDGESSYQGEDYSQSKVSTPRAQRSVSNVQQPIEDQRYYQHVPRRQESLFDDIFNDSKPQEVPPKVVPSQVVPPQVVPISQKKIIPESYIPNEPPPDEESVESDNNRRVGAKKTLNLFDDDEFSSFMDQIVQKATNKNTKPDEQPQVNQEPSKKVIAANPLDDSHVDTPPPVDTQKQPRKTVNPNIFSDSDDLFSQPSKKSQEQPKKLVVPNLFDDSDDLFTSSVKEPANVKRKASLPKLEDDFLTAPAQTTVIGKTKIKNLFDDDDDDDDFDNIFASKPSESKSFSQGTNNLFSDHSGLKPENKGLDLEKEALKESSAKESLATSQGLFDNDDDIGLNIEKETPVLKVPLVQKGLFDDKDNSNLILEKEAASMVPMLKKDLIKEVSLLKKGLFDDDDDLEDENDIFSTKPAKKDIFEETFSKEYPSNKLLASQKDALFGNLEKEKATTENQSNKDDQKEEFKQAKPRDSLNTTVLFASALSDVPPSDFSMKKTEPDNIFADDFADELEDNISINLTKPDIKTGHPSKDPEPEVKPIITPRLPIISKKPTDVSVEPGPPRISKKPVLDKALKPQKKVVEEINIKTNRAEQLQEVEVLESSKQDNTQKNIDSLLMSSEIPIADLKAETSPEIFESPVTTFEAAAVITERDESKDTSNPAKSVQEENNQKQEASSPINVESFASKPITKPKPGAVIEDKKTSPYSKQATEQNPVIEESAKKPSTIPSYKSLFHDDLPPEDESPNPTSSEESPVHTVEEDLEINPNSSSIPYSSINLFADVPPDDDFSVATSTAETKRIHSIFYDDFHETIEAGRDMRAPPSYIINDEPPPDDEDNKPVISEVKKEKPKVSKLKKMDFQINVGALLPTAKIPSFKKPEALVKSQSENFIKEDHHIPNFKSAVDLLKRNEDVPSEGQIVKERELPENILPNLNRDRAKVQIKRRPSTRKGRQESYRKSMIDETISAADQDLQEDGNGTVKNTMSSSLFGDLERQKPEAFRKSLIEETISSTGQERNIFDGNEKAQKTSLFEDFGTFDVKKTDEVSKESINQMPDRSTLFEESDKFIQKSVTSQSSSKAMTNKLPSLFGDSDSEPENIFETMKTPKSNTKLLESVIPPPSTKNLDSLFDSDGYDENPFGTPKNFIPQSTTTKEIIKTTEEKSQSELLFDSEQPAEPKAQPSKTAALKPSVEPIKITPKSSTLFGDDSDDGSNDLFKGTISVSKKPAPKKTIESKPKAKTVNKPAKPSTSLFSSDEENGSGDDLFGKAKTKVTAKKKEPVKDKTSSSLFADLSDDDSDDLFGAPKKKPIGGVNKSKPNPPATRTQPAKPLTQQAKANNSNPLSDLLGP